MSQGRGMGNTARRIKQGGNSKPGVHFCIFQSKWLKSTYIPYRNNTNISQRNRIIFVRRIYLCKTIRRNVTVEVISSSVLALQLFFFQIILFAMLIFRK